jgi:copper oxidase (laccase) domain-containing protein
VGDDVRRAFGERVAAAFVPRRDRYLFDLRAALRTLAEAAGVGVVTPLGPCTVCDTAYASYRRDGTAAGRQLSFIALT